MTKDRLFKRIAQLGSLAYQIRWVVNGTADEYVLLDELIETTIHEAKRQATCGQYSKQEREALIRFHDRVDALYGLIPWRDPKVSNANIVERNETMRQIRDTAKECLADLNVSVTDEELMSE